MANNSKRQSFKVLDEAMSDPLSDFTDSSFDIIQFLSADNTTPVDSPSHPEANRNQRINVQNNNELPQIPLGNHNNNNPNNQHHISPVTQNMQQNYMQQRMLPVSHLMYQNNGRLPDSPPITDISATGSSASPSSNSDPPYSPDNYSNYSGPVPPHNQNPNHQSIILGVHDLHNGMMVAQPDQMQIHQRPMYNDMNMSDPNCYVQVYPQERAGPPINDVANTQRVSKNQMRRQAYPMNNGYGEDQLYNMLGGNPEYSRKRPRLEDELDEIDEKNPYIMDSPQLSQTNGVSGMNMNPNMHQESVTAQYTMQQAPMGAPPTSMVPSSAGPSPPCGSSSTPSSSIGHRHGSTATPETPQHHSPQVVPNSTQHQIPLGQSSLDYKNKAGSVSNGSFSKREENLPHNPVIKFIKFEEDKWLPLYDAERHELEKLQVHVVADKGFNYSSADQCFVNQKKNHFQISVHIEAIDNLPPVYAKKDGHLMPIREFKLVFCGVKAEMPSCEIQIKQSQNDRKPVNHDPVTIKIIERQMTKVTVPRLHFQDTTLNNQRKNYRPNPDQKYFLLVIRLVAYTDDGQAHLIQAYQSERVIVRATNPGSFEPPEIEAQWQRNGSVLYTHNPVSIGADMTYQDAKLNIHGDIFHVGKNITASDRRLKEDFVEKDGKQALENMSKLHVVGYSYKPEVAAKWGLSDSQRKKTGLIAQELAEVIPDAVHDVGDFLAVDEGRVFYETLLATKELCRLTGDLDSKIDGKVEEISQRLARYARRKKLMSSGTNLSQTDDTKSVLSLTSVVSNPRPRKRYGQNAAENNSCCNSNIAQGTLLGIVLIMTACLLAMSGLYVLDYNNRKAAMYYGPSSRGYGDERIEEAPGQMVVPFGMAPVNGPPLIGSVCTHDHCHSYCCRSMGDSDGTATAPLASSHLDQDEYHYQSDILDTRKPESMIRDGTALANGMGLPFSEGVYIEIPSLNATIDSRYCIEGSCSPKRNRFNLYVPVSPNLPTISVDIRFNIPDDKIVNGCGYLSDFQNRMCDDVSFLENGGYPTLYQIDDSSFEVSIGQYVQSAYRFRVGHSTESCTGDEAGMKGNYDEYNLVFYRACSATDVSQ